MTFLGDSCTVHRANLQNQALTARGCIWRKENGRDPPKKQSKLCGYRRKERVKACASTEQTNTKKSFFFLQRSQQFCFGIFRDSRSPSIDLVLSRLEKFLDLELDLDQPGPFTIRREKKPLKKSERRALIGQLLNTT